MGYRWFSCLKGIYAHCIYDITLIHGTPAWNHWYKTPGWRNISTAMMLLKLKIRAETRFYVRSITGWWWDLFGKSTFVTENDGISCDAWVEIPARTPTCSLISKPDSKSHPTYNWPPAKTANTFYVLPEAAYEPCWHVFTWCPVFIRAPPSIPKQSHMQK